MSTISPSREQQITSAKERLLALLDGAKPVANTAAAAVPALSACPKCGAEGFSADMWCMGCGHCPKTGYEGETVDHEAQGELTIWQLIPGWLWLLLVVELALIGGAFYFSWAIGQHRARTLVSASVLALSSLLIVVSHFRAYFRTLSSVHSLGTFDIVMKPMTIWRAAARELPGTSYLFCSMAWGVTGAILTLCVIGGLDYMSIHDYVGRDEPVELPSAGTVASVVIKGASAMQTEEDAVDMQTMMSDIQNAAADANTAGGSSPQSIEEAVNELANAAPMDDVHGTGAGLDEGATSLEGGDLVLNEGDADASGGDSDSGDPGSDLVADDELAGSDDESEVEQGDSAEEADEPLDENRPSETDQPTTNPHASAGQSPADAETLIAMLPPGEVIQCAIVGFTVNAAGEPRSLLLAAPISGNWRYVARLRMDDIPAEVVAELTARFPEHRSPRPLVPCPFGGQWLTPDFFCDIHFPASATGLRFAEPTFVRMQGEEQGGQE